jgi:hypothetical protein
MPLSLAEMETQARLLSAEERARLAEVILESLRAPALADVESAWNRVVEERSRL